MKRRNTFKSLCRLPIFALSLPLFMLPILTGCGGKSGTTGVVKPTATCDKNPALLMPAASYESKSGATSTEILTDGGEIKITSMNTLDYKVVGTKTVGSGKTTDAQQTITISEVATNPDGTTLQVNGSDVEDSYQVLDGSNLLTYGSSATNTVTSPSVATPQVQMIQSTISPALSIPANPTLNVAYGPATFVYTDLASLNGGKATTNVNQNTITRTFSIESVTVPAGTFAACKEVDSTDSVNSIFGSAEHTDSTLWTVGSGPCQGLTLKRVQSHSLTGGTSTTSTEEMESLTLNGQNCTE